MRSNQKIFLTINIILFIVFLSLLFFLDYNPIINYTFSFISLSLLYIVISRHVLLYKLSPKILIFLFAIGIGARIAFIPIHPIGSDDYYRYVWDGKVLANNINPYEYSPGDIHLNKLHSDILPKHVSYKNIKTIYPPLSQILFLISYKVGGESFLGVKYLLLLFEFLTFIALYLILKKLKIPIQNILLYVLCPLPIFEFFLDAHLDGFGIAFLVLSIFFYMDKKLLLSLIFLSAAICIKPLGIILLPIYFIDTNNIKNKIQILLLPILLCFLAYLPFIFNGQPFQALINFTENWTFNGIVFNIFDLFIKNNQISRSVCAILLLGFYAAVVLSRWSLLEKIYYSIILLFIFSPVVHPWYLVWLLILLPFIPKWSGIFYVSFISLTSFTILNYQLNGVWKDYPIVLLIEYLTVIAILLYEFLHRDKRISAISN